MTLGLVLLSFGAVGAACTNPSGTSIKILGVQWGNSTHPVSAGPGSRDVPLTVSMESFGNTCALSNIEGTLVTYGDVSNFNGSTNAKYFLSSANAYSIFDMVFHLNIAANASVGQNTIETYPIYIAWNYTQNSTIRYTQELNVSLPMRGAPNLAFSIPDPSLVAGQTNNITVQVTNHGTGYAYNIGMSITSSPVINLIGSPVAIQELAPGATANTSFSAYVSPTLQGDDVTLNLNPTYIDPYGNNETNSSSASLYVLQGQGGIGVSASTQNLFSGETNNANIVLTNNGGSPIRNVYVTLTPSSSLSIIGSDGYASVPFIGAYSNVSIPLELYPSTSGTVASLGVALSYSGGSVSRTLSFLTPGYINMSKVSSTVLPAAPQVGEIYTITSTLDNLGSETAYAVTVTPSPPNGISIVGQNSSFIGDVAADTPTSVTLSFVAAEGLNPGTYTIPVTLSYVNNINQKLNQTLYYTVDISKANTTANTTGQHAVTVNGKTYYVKNGGGGGLGLVALIVILVIILVGAYWYVKRRNKGKGRR